MAKVYANLILMGRLTLSQVPLIWHDQTAALLSAREHN